MWLVATVLDMIDLISYMVNEWSYSFLEQQTGSKQEKESVKAVYCHPAYLTSMQSTSREMLGWKKHEGEISITSDMQMTPPLWQKVKNN